MDRPSCNGLIGALSISTLMASRSADTASATRSLLSDQHLASRMIRLASPLEPRRDSRSGKRAGDDRLAHERCDGVGSGPRRLSPHRNEPDDVRLPLDSLRDNSARRCRSHWRDHRFQRLRGGNGHSAHAKSVINCRCARARFALGQPNSTRYSTRQELMKTSNVDFRTSATTLVLVRPSATEVTTFFR